MLVDGLPTPFIDPARFESARARSLAAHIRGSTIELSHRAQTPHLGSALSCADILAVAYGGGLNLSHSISTLETRDRFILSKGHAAIALYSVLALQGFFPSDLLHSYAEHGSTLAEQPIPHSQPGIEAATGSLGHGLPIGVGLAAGGRIKKRHYRVAVLMSDGECNEGSVWEAAMFASAQNLSHLTVFVDFNKWQATGRSEEVMALAPLADKWRAFGWNSVEIDGHDVDAIHEAFAAGARSERPTAVIAHTIKGKGVSFMEDDNNWHYRTPTAEELASSLKELGLT